MYHKQRWTPEKIQKRLNLIAPLVYVRRSALPPFRYLELAGPEIPSPVAADVDDSSWLEIGADTYWGRWVQDFILRTKFAIPEDWDVSQPIALSLPLGDAHDFCHPEALIYVDGVPFAACDRNHQEVLLKPEWADGREHLLALHGWTGLGDLPRGSPLTKLYARQSEVVQIHQPARDFISLAALALETVNALEENDPVKYRLLNALDEAFNQLDIREPLGGEGFYTSITPALQTLKSEVEKAGEPLNVTIHAASHAHIDVAWLWTLAQTRRKAERTFYTAIRLMERFPNYRFSQSQPQLYQFIKEDQPALFETIRQRIREGRWEPLGGMWVEADCN
ncbi:MAG: alpha-mannosidase, partial [Chloroflexi bacterium]|nr:alpha-mannosidase [Chloroflexota bacterium]